MLLPMLFALILVGALSSTFSASTSNIIGYRQNRCYSCMSEMYENFFKSGLDRYFTRPRNFSSKCDDEMDVTNIHTVNCRTICLTIKQDLIIMGQPTGKRLFMRGCALSIARRGLNNHTLSMFDRYDICREMSASDLFRHEQADSQRIRVCSCLGDRCNSAPILTSNAKSFLFFFCTFHFFIFSTF